MTVTNDQIEAARSLIANALERTIEAVPATGDVDTISAWDSLAHVRILIAIEEKTGKPLDSGAIASLRSVEDVARALIPAISS